jgi:hypothetical protein
LSEGSVLRYRKAAQVAARYRLTFGNSGLSKVNVCLVGLLLLSVGITPSLWLRQSVGEILPRPVLDDSGMSAFDGGMSPTTCKREPWFAYNELSNLGGLGTVLIGKQMLSS